jgi:menaquinone-dependent protoporphyrinogen oxidase
MSTTILVAYATRYGSTQEVAEHIAAVLLEAGHPVAIHPAGEVRSLDEFDAVVLGAPIYMGNWHKNARRFLSRNKAALQQLPVAVFALGPLERDEEQMREVTGQFEKILAKVSWLAPVDQEVFVGKFDPDKLTFPYNLLPLGDALPEGDNRDWDAIRGWAGELPARLQA